MRRSGSIGRVWETWGVCARALGSRPTLLLLAILAAATLLRLGTADHSLWYDELASVEFARQPIRRLWSAWMVRETNPPLFYSLLAGSMALFGDGDIALRLLPIAIGLAGIWAAFLLGRTLGGPRAALLAAMLLALSAQHVDFSQQVRAYGLTHTAVLFACLGMVLYLRRRSTAGLVLYAAATLTALYAHTTLALFAGLAAVTMLWLLRGDRRAQRVWLVANAGVLALWSWWAAITLRQLAMPVTNIAWIAAPSFREAVDMTVVAYLPMYLRAAGPVGTALLVGLYGGLGIWVVRARRPDLTLLAVLVASAPLLLFAISQRVPIFLPRTLSWASGPALVLLSVAVVQIRSRLVAAATAAALLAFSAIGLAAWLPDRERDQWRQAAAAVERLHPLPVFVGDDAVALALLKYRASPASGFTPIVVQAPWQERWAAGLYPGPHLSPAAARRLIRTRGCAVAIGWGPMYPPILEGAATRRIGPPDRQPEVLLVQFPGGRGCSR